jgi:hypothetical protein
VLLTGGDTFTAPSSQLYLYTADSSEQVLRDLGRLWDFRSDVPSINDYGDLSGAQTVSGHVLLVPEDREGRAYS